MKQSSFFKAFLNISSKPWVLPSCFYQVMTVSIFSSSIRCVKVLLTMADAGNGMVFSRNHLLNIKLFVIDEAFITMVNRFISQVIINVSEYSFISNLEIKVKSFTSYISPTTIYISPSSNLASSGSTAIPEVVLAVEVCIVSLLVPRKKVVQMSIQCAKRDPTWSNRTLMTPEEFGDQLQVVVDTT